MPAPENLSTPAEMLTAALAKERQAYAFYEGMLKLTKVRMMQDLLIMLKDEELKHVRLIEQKLAQLRRG